MRYRSRNYFPPRSVPSDEAAGKLVILGAGGHAAVLAEIALLTRRYQLVGYTDPDPAQWGRQIGGCPVLGGDEILDHLRQEGVEHAIIGVGGTEDNRARKIIFEKMVQLGFQPAVLVHPWSFVSSTAVLGGGTAVMAGAVVNARAILGANSIVNSGAILEHDCRLEDHVHLASGAVLAGGVQVGRETHIGSGARVIQQVRIGRRCLIAAGAVVLENVPDDTMACGVPAQTSRRRKEGHGRNHHPQPTHNGE